MGIPFNLEANSQISVKILGTMLEDTSARANLPTDVF